MSVFLTYPYTFLKKIVLLYLDAGIKPTILNYLTLLVMVLVSEGFVIGDEFSK